MIGDYCWDLVRQNDETANKRKISFHILLKKIRIENVLRINLDLAFASYPYFHIK